MGWKLVRDNHREIFKDYPWDWRTSPDPVGSLVQKLGEEYGEFCYIRDPAELYDIEDVISELIALLDPSDEAGYRHWEKVKRFGTFSAHLEWAPRIMKEDMA